MRRFSKVLTAFGLSLLIALMAQSASASTLPKTSRIQVTVFKKICCNAMSDQLAVNASGRQAAELREALADLPHISSAPPNCLQRTPIPFILTFLPQVGIRPTLQATATSCGGQFVTIQVRPSGRATVFNDDCQLERAVVAAIPHDRGLEIRQAFANCLTRPNT